MNWHHHFTRARDSKTPVPVDKQAVGPIPPEFTSQGFTLDGFWGVYERNQGLETIRIRELPAQYFVSVHIRESSLKSQPPSTKGPDLRDYTTQSEQTSTGKKLGGATIGLGLLGVAILGKALRSTDSDSSPDPQEAHRVFISHSWRYESHFEEVTGLLDDARGFEYFDHSVSSDSPLDAQLPNHLRSKLRDQIRSTSVVLVLSGMYVAHSDWIQEELEMAKEMNKPIIGVIPSENERVPSTVQSHATELVDADGGEILDAIEQHA